MSWRRPQPRYQAIKLLCPSQFLIGLDGDTRLAAGNLRFAPSVDKIDVTLHDLKAGVWETVPPHGGDGDTYSIILRWIRERQGDELALERSVEHWKADEEAYRASVQGRKGEDVRLPEGIKWLRAGSYSHDCGSGVIIARAYLSEESAKKILGMEEVDMTYYYSSLQAAHTDVPGCDTRTIGGIAASMQDAGFRLWKAVDDEGKIIAVRAHVNGMSRRDEHEEMGAGNYESDGGPYSDEEWDSDEDDE